MIKVGDIIPNGTLRTKTATIHELKTEEIFSNKKVVLFSLPGAFTPTCSAKHLPGFKKLYDDIINKGVDKIICYAVNDPHVMKAWAEQNNVFGKITMISDPDASFTKKLGLDYYTENMGIRSLRFAMIIEDKVIKRFFLDEIGAFDVSSAENIFKYL